MKIYPLCLLVIPFFISCSNPTESDALVSPNLLELATLSSVGFKNATKTPANSSNPYDAAGALHHALFEAYYATDSIAESIPMVVKRVENLAVQNSSFLSLSGTALPNLSSDRIAYLVSNPESATLEVLSSSLESTATTLSVATFIDSFLALWESESDYAVLHDFIVGYESTVLTNTSMTLTDKERILITTSIVRYAAYERPKKPKKNTDPEWDLMVGNIIGSLEGSTGSASKAVLMGLVVGIVQNPM